MAYIGTQHPQHKAAVLLCLAAGKAVLCEKPMGVNAAEVREMVAEARSRGLFLMEVRVEGPLEHPAQRFLPLWATRAGGCFGRDPREGFAKSEDDRSMSWG